MAGLITAGCYFRLLQFLRDGKQTIFCNPPVSADTSGQSKESDVMRAISGRYSFNRKDADLVVQSSDGVRFPVHQAILEISISPDHEVSLAEVLHSRIQTNADDLDLIELVDDSIALSVLLRRCYPVVAQLSVASCSLYDLTQITTLRAIKSAQKYGFAMIESAYKQRLRELISEEPLAIYCVALGLGWKDEAKRAAEFMTFASIAGVHRPELESISAGAYYHLLDYHHRCQKLLRGVFTGSEKLDYMTWLLMPYNKLLTNNVGTEWPAAIECTLHDRGRIGMDKWTEFLKHQPAFKVAIQTAIQSVSVYEA